MSEIALKLLEQIRALPEEDQLLIAEELAGEDDGYDPMTDAEFRTELDRRIVAVGNGMEGSVPLDDALDELDRRLAAKRQGRATE